MHTLILLSLLGSALALPQGYNFPIPSNLFHAKGPSNDDSQGRIGSTPLGSTNGGTEDSHDAPGPINGGHEGGGNEAPSEGSNDAPTASDGTPQIDLLDRYNAPSQGSNGRPVVSNDVPSSSAGGSQEYQPLLHGSNGGTADSRDAHDIPADGSEAHSKGSTEGTEGSTEVPTNCPEDQVPHVDGSCAQPEVTRTIFVYDAPQQQFDEAQAPEIPKPKLNYNIVFVRIPKGNKDQAPIVIPPPQQKTLVYVLNKGTEGGDQQVIEVPAPQPHKPEVFYINFKEGENPQLPIGIDLESALASVAASQGQVVSGSSDTIGSVLAVGDGAAAGGAAIITGRNENVGEQEGVSNGANQFPTSHKAPSNIYGSPRANK